MPLPESVVQRVSLARLCALPGVHLDRINVLVARRGGRAIRSAPDGFPDAVGCARGRALAVEFKRPGGRQSCAQTAWQAAWESAGGIYLLVDDPDTAADQLLAALEAP
jgi:hypothetical protein